MEHLARAFAGRCWGGTAAAAAAAEGVISLDGWSSRSSREEEEPLGWREVLV